MIPREEVGEIYRVWQDYLRSQQLVVVIEEERFIRLGDYGGNMVVFWGHVSACPSYYYEEIYQMEVWCAEISLERRRRGNTSEIWGKV